MIRDTIGGIMGLFIAIVASLLTFLTFKANKQQPYDIGVERFESNLFQMLQMQESIGYWFFKSPYPA